MKNHQAMNNHFRSKNSNPGPVFYEIKILGQLDPQRSKWFEGMTIEHTEDGYTLLTGEIIDQSALYGLIEKIRNLNLALISVQQITG